MQLHVITTKGNSIVRKACNSRVDKINKIKLRQPDHGGRRLTPESAVRLFSLDELIPPV